MDGACHNIIRPLDFVVSQDRWVVIHDREDKHDFVKAALGKSWNLRVFSKTPQVPLCRFYCKYHTINYRSLSNGGVVASIVACPFRTWVFMYRMLVIVSIKWWIHCEYIILICLQLHASPGCFYPWDFLWECWNELVAMELPCAAITFPTRILWRVVSAFVTGCPCGGGRGLTTCPCISANYWLVYSK